jgi:DNA-binding NtrC family response regulator
MEVVWQPPQFKFEYRPNRQKFALSVSKAILVVEDESFVSIVTCSVIAGLGFSVLWARNAAEAKRIFFRHAGQIAMAICDAVLPDGSGIALGQCFRQASPALKLIVASGYPPALLEKTLPEQPGVRFLAKAYSSAALTAMVNQVLRGDGCEQVA